MVGYVIALWLDTVSGRRRSSWGFFNVINFGWLEMTFAHRYGPDPTEEDMWEWMWENRETIRMSVEDFDSLLSKLEGGNDQ